MKKISLSAVILVLFFLKLCAQDIDSITLSKLKLNFVVPDMPAFKSLGTNPSNLLRPSTTQAIAVNTSEFFQAGKFVLPEAFAMEISPALILNSKKGPQQLKFYQKNAVLNSFRISLGTSPDTILSASGRNLALGLRISLIDKGDPVSDPDYLQSVVNLLEDVRTNKLPEAKIAFAKSRGFYWERS